MAAVTLIITEKPSVAQSIASVIGAKNRKDGYLEGSGYLVSWCYGHLAELANADVYNEKFRKWRAEDLPIFPDEWKYVAAEDKAKHLALLKKLLNRKDVTEVVNACDAGREGELIFRTVYNLSGCTKLMKRLWISSMEDEAIRDGIRNLRIGTDYDRLYAAALCRAKADWLVGINMTRFFSIQYDNLLNVGRVVSPTLSLIASREAEIGAFTSEPFYTVVLDCGFSLVSERLKDKGEAENLAEGCRDSTVTVTKAESKEKSERAPQLYDLTSLQRDANRLLGYTAQQTLNYLQSLYEKKLCTYPRTDSRYLTDDMVETVPKLLSAAAAICQIRVPDGISEKQICNSKKVSDHHAVVPTEKAGTVDLMGLSAGEREILRLVAQQLMMAAGSPCKYKETEITAECADTEFHAKGKVMTEPGWRSIIPAPEAKEELPDLEAGAKLPINNVEVKTGKTTPPQRYTEDTLLSAMASAGEKEMPEDAERQGIGTPATRAGIIEKLISAGFAVRQKSKKAVYLVPTDIGNALITVLPEDLQSPLLTAKWETDLKRVEKGELSDKEFMTGIEDMVLEIIRNYKKLPGAEMLFPKRERRKKS